MMDKVRFGIIGIGNMGSSHAEYLSAGEINGAELTAVCDINPSREAWAKKNLPETVAFFKDYKELLASGRVDAVLIATPHYLHPVIAIDAFKAGLNVLSEKPVGVYTKKVLEMYDVAKESGKTFGVMFNQRTNPAFKKARELVQSGELGELKRCVWIITDWYRTQNYYDSGTWRATWEGEGGGVLLNQCPHNLDLWQWIFGMPKAIRAEMSFGKYHNIEVEDDVTAYAEYENGATGVFIASTGEAPGTNRLEISGSRGKLKYEGGKLTFYRNQTDEREFCFDKNSPKFGKPIVDTIEVGIETPKLIEHRAITQNFTNHLLNGEELIASGFDGIKGLSISNAMHLSAWTGRKIELPIDGDEFLTELNKRRENSNFKKTVGSDEVADLSGTFGS